MTMQLKDLPDLIRQKIKYFGIEFANQVKSLALEETLRNPGPPIDTGYLKSSAHGEVFFSHKGKAKVEISYSAPVPVGENANVFYTFRGGRWFDYAEYQHINHVKNRLWVTNALSGHRLDMILSKAKIKALEKVV